MATLNGTFVIMYTNTTIQINGKTFYNEERTLSKPLPAILQHSPARRNPLAGDAEAA